MAYTRVNWENLPSTNTPLNATNLNKMDEGIKDLDDGQIDLQTQINNLPKKVKQQWGRSMSFTMQVGQHALVMLNQTDCLMIWVAGLTESPYMSVVRVYGNEAQANFDASTNTVTITYQDNREFTGNAIIL